MHTDAVLSQAECVDRVKAETGAPISVSTIVRWRRAGVRGRKLRSFHVGGRVFVREGDLFDFIAACNED